LEIDADRLTPRDRLFDQLAGRQQIAATKLDISELIQHTGLGILITNLCTERARFIEMFECRGYLALFALEGAEVPECDRKLAIILDRPVKGDCLRVIVERLLLLSKMRIATRDVVERVGAAVAIVLFRTKLERLQVKLERLGKIVLLRVVNTDVAE